MLRSGTLTTLGIHQHLHQRPLESLKTASYNGMPIAMVDLSASGASGSIPFSGNAVLLHATSPFTVTYTVNAVAQPSKTVNNVQSAMAARSTRCSEETDYRQ